MLRDQPSSFTFAVSDKISSNSSLPAMRTRLTWKHVHFPLRWSPVVIKTIGKMNGVCTLVQNAVRPKHLTWGRISPSRTSPSHRYRPNQCRGGNAECETLREVCLIQRLGTRVSITLLITDKTHSGAWRGTLKILPEATAPLSKVVRSESRFNSLRLPGRPSALPAKETALKGLITCCVHVPLVQFKKSQMQL